MAGPSEKNSTSAGKLTVEHVTNSLFQIESWIGAVRTVLNGLNPATPVPTPGGSIVLAAAIKSQKDCPPPKTKRRRKKKPRHKKNK